jgi:hypothetical protein
VLADQKVRSLCFESYPLWKTVDGFEKDCADVAPGPPVAWGLLQAGVERYSADLVDRGDLEQAGRYVKP